MWRRIAALILLAVTAVACTMTVQAAPPCRVQPNRPDCRPTPTPTATATPTPTPTPTSAPSPTPTPLPPASGFVQRSGTDLTLNGARYRFTGTNSYNLLTDEVECSYIAQPDGPALAMNIPGVEVVRAWFFADIIDGNWAVVDNTLNAARTRGDKLVVTLTDHWGACEPGDAKTESWYTTGYKLTYRTWVQTIVTRYRNDPAILMWQMVNEAESKKSDGSCSDASVLLNFANDIGGLIRSIDPNHLISLGTLGGSQCGIEGTKYQTIHASAFIDICEFHDYESDVAMPSIFQTRINQCNALGKPMFVGEIGRKGVNYSSLQARANVFITKLDAAFAAGVDGDLVWNLELQNCNPQDYGICSNDPVWAAMATR